MKSTMTLFLRDIKKSISLRTILIWVAMAAMGVFFFMTTGGRTNLLKHDKIDFMSLFLPHMIFGSWAILSVYFDLVSADREHNVMDLLICSGISKTRIYLSKILVCAALSLLLAVIYMLPVTATIIGLSGDFSHITVLLQYIIPLWGYITVIAALGVLISVVARSSKASLIWSLAIGLLLMPRLFVMLLEGLGQALNWSKETVNNLSLLSPGIMMQALSDVKNTAYFGTAAAVFSISIVLFFGVAFLVFKRQDEFNYGE